MSEQNNNAKRGGISVETQHIFPIIKKWLYSDKDIFLREIVSNASDAVVKLKRLASLGQTELPDGTQFRVSVVLDKDAKTITVTDNGIGMTEDELERYICSIALSGALEFIQKYESDSKGDGIIGHFGLGFYSSFMIAETVELDTLSYSGGPAVHWSCTEAGEYEITPSDRTERGTSVIMHVSDAEADYLSPFKLREILNKYCSFMPVEIYFDDGEEKEVKDGEQPEEPKPINDTVPLWQKNSADVTEEEYKAFYHKLFMDADDPLFWIHINADYPLNFKGILYFPRIKNEAQPLDGQVKLFYNQVFVADNIKEVLPDYLLMLRGALDCPELPLNVSRSYLQDNAYVRKIAQHITKKVADKLNNMCVNDREKYEKVYSDVRIFIEYACLREQKFYDRVKGSLLLHLTDDTFKTIDDYLESAKEKHENTVYYANDTALQAQPIAMMKDAGIDVAIFDLILDSQYITAVEQYREGVKFVRVDAGIADVLRDSTEAPAEISDAMRDLFRKVSGDDKLTVKAETLRNTEVPAVLSVSEESRRFEEMMKMYSLSGNTGFNYPLEYTLSLNIASPLWQKLNDLAGTEKEEIFASYLFRLAQIAQKKLTAEELSAFLSDSYRLLGLI